MSAQSAMAAACLTTGTTSVVITCPDTLPADVTTDTQGAIDAVSATATDLTLNIGNLTEDDDQTLYVDTASGGFTGAIVVNNTGYRLGSSPALSYDLTGVGTASGGSTNTLNFTNSGTMDYNGSYGDLDANDFGGAVAVTNTGSMGHIFVYGSQSTVTVDNAATGTARRIDVTAEGDISITNAGSSHSIYASDTNTGNATAPNITIDNSGSAWGLHADTGGTIDIINSGTATSITAVSQAGWRTPTSGEAAAGVVSTAGKDVVVTSTGYVDGDITAISEGGVAVNTVSGSGTITQTTTFSSGTATVTAGDTNGNVLAWALAGATVDVVGEVDGDVTAQTWGPGTAVQSAYVTSGGSGGSSSVTYDNAGVAAVTVAEGAEVWGTATASSIGGATAEVNGYVYDLNVYSSSFMGGYLFDTNYTWSVTSTASGGTSSWSRSVTNSGETAEATIGANGYVDGDVNVWGDAGASLTSAGLIWGDVNVVSSVSNGVSGGSSTTILGASGGSTQTGVSTETWTSAGGTASFDNSGTVYGDGGTVAVIGSAGASLDNTGEIYDNVVISAMGQNWSYSNTETTVTPPVSGSATHSWVESVTASVTGADASATNSGLIDGDVWLAGATGTFDNAATGAVGSVSVGAWVAPLDPEMSLSPNGPFPPYPYMTFYTGTITDTESLVEDNLPPVRTITAAPVFAQTYTINNNGLIFGYDGYAIDIFGVTPASSVTATVNLNNGSITLGDIEAQHDDAYTHYTDTTVNLNGGGFLGSDRWLTFGGDELSPDYVRVHGVNELNKTGAGTFLIAGAGNWYEYDLSGQVVWTDWTLDIGTFNINAGEIQLAVGEGYEPMSLQVQNAMSSSSEFGILGDVVNNATLVIGTRVDPAPQQFANSLVTSGQAIDGIHVVQSGNFTQSSGGTTVVGIAPSVVRIAPMTVPTSGVSTEVLGPLLSLVNVPYFTTTADALAHGQAEGMISTASRWDVTGDLTLAGHLQAVVTRDGIYQNGDGGVVFSYTGTGNVTATATQNIASQFVNFNVVHDTTAKTVSLVAARNSYATAATNANAAAAGVALDSTIPVVVSRLTQNAASGNAFLSINELGLTQDLANIISGMDWRVGAAGAAAVLNDLSSGEFYGSLGAVDQNVLFGDAIKGLAGQRQASDSIGTTFWMNPVGNFAKYTRDHSGASDIRANSYGVAGGFDFAYGDEAAFGIGVSYAKHDVNAQGTPEKADADTITMGAYWTQTFGPIYANAMIAYGFSTFDARRSLPSLARATTAHFKGSQFDISAEVGYNLQTGSVEVTPFAKLALRRWSMDGFTENGGQSVGLVVAKDHKSVFSPELGVRLSTEVGKIKPYLEGSYTIRGDMGTARDMQFVGGGDAFTVKGIDPTGYGTITGGVTGSLSSSVSLFLNGSYSFGGGNKVGRIGGGVGIKF